ncbi:M20/M25/M40 family metallo-hydrolase [Paenibacillus sp. MER 99-2]|uniref:M20/M25/M40 family metallo-hydrolase n=1 Tax=Paenibacillus sp. MER 99-2 TaxID=2939572 RepID=UPI00203E7EB5|nr:M20/M25/M40 family metallo-hydrolase [Paenibacillus sp. MER 99-2]MCM3174765.1 M20/M25/M40 family metallo-hydrolase [Paenibacillus sp. MER 99-2]
MVNNVDSFISQNEELYLERLFRLLRQPSISTQNIGMAECASLVQELFSDYGIKNRLYETEGHPIIYGEWLHPDNETTVLIYGHYDVQPPDPLEEWQSDPFEPEIRNGRIYARGAGDNKGQFVASILGVKAYLDIHGRLPVNVKWIIEGEEEAGSRHLAAFVEQQRELLQTDLVYTTDGSSHESGAQSILLGVRGALGVELVAQEARWDNHSGNLGNIVPNPVWRLTELLHTMRKGDQVTIEGFYDGVKPPTPHEEQILRDIPFDLEGVRRKSGYDALEIDSDTYHRKLMFEPTLNVSGLFSGHTGKGGRSIIPARATARLDIRLVAGQDPDQVFEALANHVQKHDASITLTRKGAVPASRTPADHPAVLAIAEAIEQSSGQRPVIQPSLGGTLPDYVWTQILNVPSIIVPYANYDQNNHGPNENLEISYFFRAIRSTYYVLDKLSHVTFKT